MKGNQAGAMPFPDVAQFAQHLRVVVHAGRRLNAQRVKFFGGGEHVCHLGESGNHATAVAKNPDRATLPIALAGLVRVLQLTHQIGHVIIVFGQAFQASDEARPRPALQLIEHGGVVRCFAHGVSCQGRTVCADWSISLG